SPLMRSPLQRDLAFCRRVKRSVERALREPLRRGRRRVVDEVCFLSAALHHHCSGRPGGGLTLGQLQDLLWRDLLLDRAEGFGSSGGGPHTYNADYYFRGVPISHKSVGWNGSGVLALAWSKNPTTIRTRYESHVVV